MFQLVFPKRFKRSLKVFLEKHPELQEAWQTRLAILQKNPRDPLLKAHKLTGKLKGYLAARITFEYRVVFYLEDNKIYLLAIGTHEEVY
jgi:mRNA-degrading endonuclease YafQ of YafQ-DinJ toxin-antitoxin module